ncbi:RNA polymerase sigma-70 factor, ECF subfamily [Sphingomonas laterariae]|uniref:RNA polymerase sigma-70 factor, ECF subfamily n=1 Tax=Edaphosphingomonas laterariae TaxID=861865 RepID=A0A239DSF3_9SPHN|nr:sigma-70 family RNA polymerase sigma factor [Sphingomonas laterariae]SNS35119.1 RNA polymerase sigma-70 factor, ECF subfamily [Sphingomonas laterariae]
MNWAPRDGHGWRQLVRRIARATRDPDRAEDHLHAAYVRLAEYRSRSTVANPAGFLVRAAANIAVDDSRRRWVRGEYGPQPGDIAEFADNGPLQLEMLQLRQRLERVRLGLDELSPRTRQIFLMHRIEGLKYREIAEQLGITMSAVEKHIAKAALFLAEWTEGW